MTIRSRPNHPEASELIDYHDQFIKRQSVLDETIQADIESIGFRLKTKTDAIQNKFISSFTEPYNWSSSKGTVVNEAASITNYPGIQGLMEEINATFGLKMNSVLVSCYASGHVCARAHDDGESVLDPNQPICVVSFGAVRKVEFISKWSTDPQRSDYCLEPKDGSLYVMKPGCQTYFKHRVRRDKKLNDSRISLSFRCFKPAGTTVEEPVVPKAPAPSEVKTTPPSFSLPTSTPKLDDAPMGFSPFLGHQTFYSNGSNDWSNSDTDKVCLLFGSSITTRVEESRMKRGSRTLINLSKSGAKICDLIGLADKFCIDQPVACKVNHLKPPKRKIYNYKRANWDQLNRDIGQVDWHQTIDCMEPETAWKTFKEILFTCVDRSIPKINVNGNFLSPWFDSECYEAYRSKERAHIKFKASPSISRELKRDITRKKFKKICCTKMRDNLYNHDDPALITKKFWSHVKANSKSHRIPECVQLKGIFRRTPKEKCDLFNEYFFDQFSEASSYGIPIDWSNDDAFDIEFTPTKVECLLKKLNSNKACGPDAIHGKIL
ncbi:hypothetical protein ACHWQZ_G011919 [Mnemiopsis leidyi]